MAKTTKISSTGDFERELPWSEGDRPNAEVVIEKLLGSGAYGAVYQFYNKSWNDRFAVKVLVKKDPEARDVGRFIREYQCWMDLGLHPCIATCHMGDIWDNRPVIISDLFQAGTLADWFKGTKLGKLWSQKRLDALLKVGFQIATGLEYAHEKGLIHADVKPSNVLMTQSGDARVSDFGATNAVDASGMAGTARYDAPERSIGGSADERTDIFSWAVMMLEGLMGEASWKTGLVASEILSSQMEKVGNTIFKNLFELLSRCLDPVAQNRPSSFAPVRREFQGWVTSWDGSTVPMESIASTSDVINNQGVSEFKLGSREKALELWEEAIRLNPINVWGRYNLDLHRFSLGQISADVLENDLIALAAIPSTANTARFLLKGFRRWGFGAIGNLPPSEGKPLGEDERKEPRPRKVWSKAVHQGKVTGVCLFPDSKIVSVGRDGRLLCIRNSEGTFRSHLIARSREHGFTALTSRPGNGLFATGDPNGQVNKYQMTRGGRPKNAGQTTPHGGSITAIHIDRDGRTLATVGWDRVLRIRSDQSESSRDILFSRPLSALAMDEGKEWIVLPLPGVQGHPSSNDDSKLRLIIRRQDSENDAELSALDWNADGLITGYIDGSIRFWNPETGKPLSDVVRTGSSGAIEACAITPDGRIAASVGWDTKVRIWLFAGRRGICAYTLDNDQIVTTCLSITDDGNLLAVGDMAGRVHLWDLSELTNSDVLENVRRADREFVPPRNFEEVLREDLEFNEASKRARQLAREGRMSVAIEALREFQRTSAQTFDRRVIEEIDRLTGDTVPISVRQVSTALTIRAARPVVCIAWSPKGDVAAVGQEEGPVLEIDTNTGVVVNEHIMPKGLNAKSVAFTNSGEHLAIGSASRTVCVFSRSLSDSPCNSIRLGEGAGIIRDLCSGTERDDVYCVESHPPVWRVECKTARKKIEFDGQTLWGTSVRMLDDGERLICASGDRSVRCWNLKTGVLDSQLLGHLDWPTTATSWGNDGSQLVSGDAAGNLIRWDPLTRTVQDHIRGHPQRVVAISALAQPELIISAGHDGSVNLWDLQRRRMRSILPSGNDPITCLSVAPSGRKFAIGRASGLIEIQMVDWIWPGEQESEADDWETFNPERSGWLARIERRKIVSVTQEIIEHSLDLNQRPGAPSLEGSSEYLATSRESVKSAGRRRVANTVNAIRILGAIPGVFANLKRSAVRFQVYLCGSLRDFHTCVELSEPDAQEGSLDGLLWTTRGMALMELHDLEDAYDAARLALRSGAHEAEELIDAIRKLICLDRDEVKNEPVRGSLTDDLSLSPIRIGMPFGAALFSLGLLIVATFLWAASGLVLGIEGGALGGSYLLALSAAAGIYTTCSERSRPARRRTVKSSFISDGCGGTTINRVIRAYWAGEQNPYFRFFNPILAGLGWGGAVLVLINLGAASSTQVGGVWNDLLQGLRVSSNHLWWSLVAVIGLIWLAIGLLRTSHRERVVTVHGEPALSGAPRSVRPSPPPGGIRIRPGGNISVISLEEVRGVNPYLAKAGACPSCRSRELLWYQYGDKSLTSGGAIYIRCQACGHDDCTEL